MLDVVVPYASTVLIIFNQIPLVSQLGHTISGMSGLFVFSARGGIAPGGGVGRLTESNLRIRAIFSECGVHSTPERVNEILNQYYIRRTSTTRALQIHEKTHPNASKG